MARILVTGGTGLVGQQLISLLHKQKHEVAILTRNPKKTNEYLWDLHKKHVDDKAFIGIDYIIHLAGAGVADKRWTKKRKEEILNSRVSSTQLLYQKVTSLKIPLKGFICASATGYYGAITSETIFSEADKPANDFLGSVCDAWEQTALSFQQIDIPVTILRTGIVLTEKGGALQKIKTPVISPLGNGKQYLPWIHIDDLINLYYKATTDPYFTGIYNAVAPEHQTNYSFSKQVAKTFKKPFLGIGVPAFLLKLALGDMSQILLEGSRISTKKLETKNYTFIYPNLNKALESFVKTTQA